MPVELCSESTPGLVLSPRISFSHDLSQSDVVPVDQPLLRSNSSSGTDFDFCISESYDHESSSADELFSDGKILPIQIKKKTIPTKQITQSELRTTSHNTENGCEILSNESLKETKATSPESDEKQNSKSFWPFKRSSSLNCGSSYARTLCPLPLLSRSNSTGSSSNSSKKTPSSLSKEHHQTQKQNSRKNQYSAVAASKSSQYSSNSGSYQKPPLKKSYGSYGNGTVRVNPVLNVPSGNLFGLGSIFFNGKEKEKNKKK